MIDIKVQLSKQCSSEIVEEIFIHYVAMKRAYLVQDWEKCLVRGGKLGEAVMRALHFIRTGTFIKTISVESETNDIAKQTGLPESVRLLIPRAVRILYDHRSKRGGAHASFDPQHMDCSMVISVADWVLAELVRLYCADNAEDASKFVIGIISRSVPYIEQIDGDFVVLQKGLTARQEIGRILYSRYPFRTTTNELKKWVPNHSEANVSMTIINMRKDKHVHSNDQGHVLTAAGIHWVEEETPV